MTEGEELTRQLAAERERADYAWRNTRTIDAARQEEMRKRDAAEAENAELRVLLRRWMRQLEAWQEKYGAWHPQWLPPAGVVDTENGMTELILTDEEKAAALWSDLDDATLGKLVKKKIAFLTDAASQLDRVTTFAAAMLLCCSAAEQNASEIALEIDGLTQEGREFGDWRVVAMKTDNAKITGG